MAYDEHHCSKRKVLCYDIFEQIVYFLPVKSLLRFKSVCSQSRDLISSGTLVKSHRLNSATRHVNNKILLGTNSFVQCESKIIPRSPFIPSNSSELARLYNPFSLLIVYVHGSCNGLILVSTRKEILLWNPCIREHVKIFPDVIYRKIILCGLGYNSMLDEYKVICIYGHKYEYGMPNILLMYSSKIGYWKRVACDFTLKLRESCRGVAYNGCPHWAVEINGNSVHDDDIIGFRRLVYFDTVDDKFKSLSTPTGWLDRRYSLPKFDLLGGCICATISSVANIFSPKKIELWIMNDYGVKDSWTKLFAITQSVVERTVRSIGLMKNDNEVVLIDGDGNIATYDIRTKEAKTLVTTMEKFDSSEYQLVEYSESLVSPCKFARGDQKVLEVTRNTIFVNATQQIQSSHITEKKLP